MSSILTPAVIFLPFCLVIAGCQTAAQVEAQRIASQAEKTISESDACYARVLGDPRYALVKTKTSLHTSFESNPPLHMLTNEEYPDDDAVAALTAMHSALEPCRKITIEGAGATHPAYVSLLAEHYAWTDGLYVMLVKKEVTWGRANEMIMEHRQRFVRQNEEVASRINQELQNAHQYQLQQRQAAAAALQQWSYQQQILNAMRQPTTTNCYYVSNMLNCTSY